MWCVLPTFGRCSVSHSTTKAWVVLITPSEAWLFSALCFIIPHVQALGESSLGLIFVVVLAVAVAFSVNRELSIFSSRPWEQEHVNHFWRVPFSQSYSVVIRGVSYSYSRRSYWVSNRSLQGQGKVCLLCVGVKNALAPKQRLWSTFRHGHGTTACTLTC